MYVFGRRPIDLQQCTLAFRELYPDSQSHVVILYDVIYSHAIGESLLFIGLVQWNYPCGRCMFMYDDLFLGLTV